MAAIDRMKHKLRILAGLPDEPTDEEFSLIVTDIIEVSAARKPTELDWKQAAGRHVPRAGTRKYAGEDMSDLNALLVRILNQDETSGGRIVRK